MIDYEVTVSICVGAYSKDEVRDKLRDGLGIIEDELGYEEPFNIKIEEVGEWFDL